MRRVPVPLEQVETLLVMRYSTPASRDSCQEPFSPRQYRNRLRLSLLCTKQTRIGEDVALRLRTPSKPRLRFRRREEEAFELLYSSGEDAIDVEAEFGRCLDIAAAVQLCKLFAFLATNGSVRAKMFSRYTRRYQSRTAHRRTPGSTLLATMTSGTWLMPTPTMSLARM